MHSFIIAMLHLRNKFFSTHDWGITKPNHSLSLNTSSTKFVKIKLSTPSLRQIYFILFLWRRAVIEYSAKSKIYDSAWTLGIPYAKDNRCRNTTSVSKIMRTPSDEYIRRVNVKNLLNAEREICGCLEIRYSSAIDAPLICRFRRWSAASVGRLLPYSDLESSSRGMTMQPAGAR